jgi:hypothetical protein
MPAVGTDRVGCRPLKAGIFDLVRKPEHRGHAGERRRWSDLTAGTILAADHLKVFADPDSANEWFKENDPEDVAFEYQVEGST